MEFVTKDNGEFKTQLKLNSIVFFHSRNVLLFKIWFVIDLNCRNERGKEIENNTGCTF